MDLGKKIRVVSVPEPMLAPLFTSPKRVESPLPAERELVPLKREGV